jgi:PTS system mannose-specific IIA component
MLGIGIEPEDDAEQARERILAAIQSVDTGEGVVILTDMFGGTPSNLAISVMKPDGVEVIAGVNLPMMIKLASARGKVKLEEAVNQAQEAARKYINVAGNLLSGKN